MSLPIPPDPTSPTAPSSPASAPSPQPVPDLISPISHDPDPAANCGMPDRPLPPHPIFASSPTRARPSPARSRRSSGRAASSLRTSDGAGTAPSGSPLPAGEGLGVRSSLPLADRCWDLFCAGKSYSAIGRLLDIDRETAARHVKAIHHEVQADRRADRALALTRALAVQQRIQATAWDLLTHATTVVQPTLSSEPSEPSEPSVPSAVQSTSSSEPSVSSVTSVVNSSPVSSVPSVAKPSSPSLADCARLLNIILASARETARLELLYERDAPARQADQAPPEPVHIIIERIGDPDLDPLYPPPSTPPQPPAATDAPISAPHDGESLEHPSVPRPIPPSQPAPASPATADAPPAGAPTAPTPAPPSDAGRAEISGAEQSSPSEPAPTWIPVGNGSMVWGTPAPLSSPGVSAPAHTSETPPHAWGGVRGEARPRPRRVRFGLPVAGGYPLG